VRSIVLHELNQALKSLCDAYHEGKLTDVQFKTKVDDLTAEWIRIERAFKKNNILDDKFGNVINIEFHAPKIVVKKDHDGFFAKLVNKWCKAKKTPWHCDTIVVTATPRAQGAVTCWYSNDNPKELHMQFYSALRRDFGLLTKEELQTIIDEWM
jgi:hypothetical protein